MEFTGVYHKTSEQFSYAQNEEELVVNLKTGYDVRRVFIHYGDPFEAGILGGKEKWVGKREEIVYKKRLLHQIWWTTTLRPAYKRCKYYFELHTDTEVWYYFEDGFLTEEQLGLEGRMLQCFTVPWMNPADVNRTPDWVNETVWYQIFPDRFYRSGTTKYNVPQDRYLHQRWGSQPEWRPNHQGEITNSDYFGGDLEGIIQKLDYLQSLGITCIYLNPIFEAHSNHRYDTADYTKVDPLLGTKEDFKRLCKEANKRGMHIMLDGVFNHTGSDSIYFNRKGIPNIRCLSISGISLL